MSVLCLFLKPNRLRHVSRNISHLSKINDSNDLEFKVTSDIGL